MSRIPPVSDPDGLDEETRAAYERIVESRGGVSRPFEVLLHAPALARAVAELGHAIRFESHLEDAIGAVTLATGRARGRGSWDAPEARDRPGSRGHDSALDRRPPRGREAILVPVVAELCAAATSRGRRSTRPWRSWARPRSSSWWTVAYYRC
jgi:hypothetical protein